MNQVTDDPFETSCYAFAVRKAARAVTNFYDLALKPTGLRITQMALVHAISARQPVALTTLADKLSMDRTTLTRNLGPLERDGLVTIHADPDDRRARVVSLTPDGTQKLAQAVPLWEQAQENIASRFGLERAARLRDDLQDLAATDLQPASDGSGHNATEDPAHDPTKDLA